MSSSYVREKIEEFFENNITTEDVVDLTAMFGTLQDTLTEAGITYGDDWVGLQYIGNNEVPVGLNASNTVGKYRELGSIFIHVVAQSKLGVASSILGRAESIMSKFRGQRIGNMTIDSITPPNFSDGATIDFEGGYTSCSIILNYTCDVIL